MKNVSTGGMTGKQTHSTFIHRWSQKYDSAFLIFVPDSYLVLINVVLQSLMH